jgi:hypothetical protein
MSIILRGYTSPNVITRGYGAIFEKAAEFIDRWAGGSKSKRLKKKLHEISFLIRTNLVNENKQFIAQKHYIIDEDKEQIINVRMDEIHYTKPKKNTNDNISVNIKGFIFIKHGRY